VRGARERIEEDLLWLGLDWDEPPLRQSERSGAYEAAVAKLQQAGLIYPCDCSRAELTRAASAPHEGEEAVYPGLCRERDPSRPMKRQPALRVRVPDEEVLYEDGALGTVRQNLARAVGDFVVRRGDGVFAYQLAVVVDDAETGVTDVVRGADLVASTPRQLWLASTLGYAPRRYLHVPLVFAEDGGRLEKRARGVKVRELREAGVSADRVIGVLAHGLGLTPTDGPQSARGVATGMRDREPAWPREPWRVPHSWD
jgi:glutamyl-tRNA synthetase